MTGPSVRLQILPTAAQEIVEQAQYYRTRSGDDLAGKWQSAVTQTISSLRILPERGTLTNFKAAAIQSLRRIGVPGFPKHLIFYQYIEDPRMVVIVSVLHGARDLEALFSHPESS